MSGWLKIFPIQPKAEQLSSVLHRADCIPHWLGKRRATVSPLTFQVW